MLSISCGDSNPKGSRLETAEQIPRLTLLARGSDARGIVGSRLEIRFRDSLMCVLASVRNIFAVCFERVRPISTCEPLSVRNVNLLSDFASVLKRRRAGNFLSLALTGAASGAARYRSASDRSLFCLREMVLACGVAARSAREIPVMGIDSRGEELMRSFRTTATAGSMRAADAARAAWGSVGVAPFAIEDVGEAGVFRVLRTFARFSDGTGGLLRSIAQLFLRGLF